jgi:hypothetical protein
MSKEKFREARLSKDNRDRLDLVNNIILEYQAQGYRLTLRQLYYQLVSRDIIANKLAEYAKLSKLLTEGRMGGIVDWDAIEDRLRKPSTPSAWESPEDGLDAIIQQYKKPRMAGQENYLEVWVEKDALSGVLSRVTNKYHVPICVNRGYSSVSAMYSAANRFINALNAGADTVKIIYLGDYDPSGIDMIRDVNDRILEFLMNSRYIANQFWGKSGSFKQSYLNRAEDLYEGWDEYTEFEKAALGAKVWVQDIFSVDAIALTKAQIKKYNPPPNPAKMSDPRAAEFVKSKGSTSWEVDALKPQVLDKILTDAIESAIDLSKYNAILVEEANDIKTLEGLKDYI